MHDLANFQSVSHFNAPTKSAEASPEVEEEHEAMVSTCAQPQRRLGDEPGVAGGQLQGLLQRGADVGHAAHVVPALS